MTIEYPEPKYALINTSRGDLPAVVVVNAALRNFPHRDIFPWHLSVLIFADELGDHGMPTPKETRLIDAVGDEIERAILENHNALFLARETHNGRRQLLFRVHDPAPANGALQALLALPAAKREWDFRMEGDESWRLAQPCFSLLDAASQ